MFDSVSFYYARSFACFTKPYSIRYSRAPKYLRSFQDGCYISTPFTLNYINRKYHFSEAVGLTRPPASSFNLSSLYRSVTKPSRQILLPVLFFSSKPIATYYYPDGRPIFYRAFFFKRFFFLFFSYRIFQVYVLTKAIYFTTKNGHV